MGLNGQTYTRRQLLSGMATVATGAAIGRLGFGQAAPPQSDARLFVAGRIEPFSMTQVRLLDGEFKTAAEINHVYLASLSTDRLLHSFRVTSGMTSTAKPYGGWEKPDCELRGHFAGGHYLSAAALAYASSGNDTLRKNGNLMVAELARCQKMNGNGYLGAYPEGLFERLARGEKVWAPFYTLHKIMAGLLDMYVHTGNEQALKVAESLAGWVRGYFEGISDEQGGLMLRTEYGGMNEVLANLYGLTSKQQYLDTARFFEQSGFLDPLGAHRDELKGLHANTHVPKVIGAARMYELTGQTRYRDIAAYFLEEVLTERSYAIGNTSNGEHWHTNPGDLAGTLSLTDAECCVGYNLMKLERHLFAWTGDARWMDAYERSMFNCRLGTQNPEGLKQYFVPMAAGYWKFYNSAEDSFWCCTGTGAEEFAKFTDSIYFHDANDVYVNQFIASELNWKEKQFGLRQSTAFPREQRTMLVVKTETPQQRAIHVRIPGWIASGGSVRVNGKELEAFAQAGGYLTLTRTWHDGDKVEVMLPMALWTQPLPGDVTLQAAMYGPLVLAAEMGQGPKDGSLKIGGYDTTPKEVPPAADAPQVVTGKKDAAVGKPEWMEVVSSADLKFKTVGQKAEQTMKPLYTVTDEKYAVYWKTEKS
jgi:uncharacterized protein